MSDPVCAFHPDRPAVSVCARCQRAICEEDGLAIEGGVLCAQCVAEVRAAARRPALTHLLEGAPVTRAIIGINVAVFVAMIFYGSITSDRTLLRFGALPGTLPRGEWWRLVTAMFVHIGPGHLIANMLGLLLFGGAVEKRYGKVRFAALYLCAGVLGSAASLAFGNRFSLSAGASGAIFAVLGAWVPFVIRHRDAPEMAGQLRSWAFLLAIQIYFSVSNPRIDVRAHMGGLIGGIVIGTVLELSSSLSVRVRAAVAFVGYALVLIAAYVLVSPHFV